MQYVCYSNISNFKKKKVKRMIYSVAVKNFDILANV